MRILKLIIAFLFLALFTVIILSSCSSTNKHKTVSVTKTDSVSHVKTDSAGSKKKAQSSVRRSQTANSVKKNITAEKTTITVYDTVYIQGKQQVKYVIVKEKATDKTKTSSKTDTKDSTSASSQHDAAISKTTDTDVHKVEKVKEKAVKRIVFSWWWLLLLIPAYLVYRYWPVIKAVWARFTI